MADCASNMLYSITRKKVYSMRTDQPHKKDPEVVQEAIRDYVKNNLTAAECAVKYGMGKTTFKRYLNRFNVEKNFESPRYEYNKSYFEIIDSEEKAYWLGFIAADGCIGKSGLELALKSTDMEHLRKFVKAIDGDENMIKTKLIEKGKKTYEATRISVNSTQMTQDLFRYGIVKNKSLILDFPNFLNDEMLRHYIRGYFDGDGSICTAGKAPSGAQKYNISIIATVPFLTKLMDKLLPLSIDIVSLEKKHKMAIWKKGGMTQIKYFLDYIYENATIYLQRKHEYYLRICRPETSSQKSLR